MGRSVSRPAGAVRGALLTALAVLGLYAPARAETTFPLRPCGGVWVATAGYAWGTARSPASAWRLGPPGPGANVIISFRPTRRTRTAARRAATWNRVWVDLRRCTGGLPSGLQGAQIASLRKQLICHVVWATGTGVTAGGSTWDLEAWRANVPLAEVLSPFQVIDRAKRCNWGPASGPALPPARG